MTTSPEHSCRQGQNRGTLLAHRCVGETFRATPERRGRGKTSRSIIAVRMWSLFRLGIHTFFSKLKGIEKQLVSLSGKSAPLRFLDSAQDSEDVNGLLEDLQEAVNAYMVRPQP